MAYRRKQGLERSATFVEDDRSSLGDSSSPAMASPGARRFADDSHRPERSLAAQALLAASAARGEVPSALADRFLASPSSSSSPRASSSSSPRSARSSDTAQDPFSRLYNSMSRSPLKKDEAKQGLWGILAQQAKVMLDENEDSKTSPLGTPGGHQALSQSRWSYDRTGRKSESPTFEKGAEAVKLDIGGKIKNTFEEGLTMMAAENRTAMGGGRKLQTRRKACGIDIRNSSMSPDMSPVLADVESPQIKASRDVASAMAAKAKLLQRELKTVKADLVNSKERCTQLEEENRQHRDGNSDGNSDADEDLIRQQLEALLAEKAQLANENTVYARENRFMREIVEFHQLNTQGVVHLQEDIEEEEEGESKEENTDEETQQPCDDLRPLSSPLSTVQEEAAPEHMPAIAAPQSPLCSRDKVPAAAQSPQSPCRLHKVSLPKAHSQGTVSTDSAMSQSINDGSAGSPETTPARSFNDDKCSPEIASDR